MKKLILVSFIIFILFCNSLVLAVDINMNITEDFNTTIDNDSNNEIVVSNDVVENIVNPSRPTSSQMVSTSTTSQDFELTVSDIIDIILIAVGIVLILLSIAILIKLF